VHSVRVSIKSDQLAYVLDYCRYKIANNSNREIEESALGNGYIHTANGNR
jgi:hypothetical protein